MRLMFNSRQQASDVLSQSGNGFVMDHDELEKLLWCRDGRMAGSTPILVRKGAWTLIGPEVQKAIDSLRSRITDKPTANVSVLGSWQETIRSYQDVGTTVHISDVPKSCSGACATDDGSCLQ